ncbi:MAG: hypothetical protein ACRDTM_16605, partial [Micromonosporaceae bacterium]
CTPATAHRTVRSVNEKDQHLAQLLSALKPLDGWLARVDPSGARESLAPRSALVGDDRYTDPYQLSHAAWNSLSHAVDHLHCLRSLIADARIVHMYAPYTVLRAALENAATAVWLLAPRTRTPRILRRLQLAALDCRNSNSIQTVMGHTPRRTLQDRLADLRTLAAARGLDPREATTWSGWGEILKAAGDRTDVGATLAVVIWKACSGIAHGDFWATISVSERAEIGGNARVTHQRIEANTSTLHYATRITVDMTAAGWALYDARARSPY